MKYFLKSILHQVLGTIVLLSLFSFSKYTPPQKADIIIYGGTSAGIVAAIQGSRMGKSVILIEPSGRIGGLTTGGLGQTDIGNKNAIGGISREFYQNIRKYYSDPSNWKWQKRSEYMEKKQNQTSDGEDAMWTFEPSAAIKTYHDMLASTRIHMVYGERLKRKNSVKKSGATITKIVMESGSAYEGKMFIDATYEGDLLAAAGVSYTIGRENNEQYKETLNGVFLSHSHQLPNGIDPYKISGVPKSGLLWGISSESLQPRGSGDKKVQAYNFRICLTDSTENMISITRPQDYDPTKFELLARLFVSQPNLRNINDYFIWTPMPNRKTDINNKGGFSTDMIGMNYNWLEASFAQREKIFDEHLSYTKGLLYFMKSDPRVPESIRKFMSHWGYPKDEYIQNDHFTPQLYIREGRRMIGEYVMTEHNCQGKEIVKDGIGMAAYGMDSHNCQRIVVNGMVKNEGNVEVGGFSPYPISYRSIIPKRTECTNLLVPVSLSASHIAFGSIRMEPVFMVLGQSAATAAAIAINNQQAVQDISYQALKEKLLTDKQILSVQNNIH